MNQTKVPIEKDVPYVQRRRSAERAVSDNGVDIATSSPIKRLPRLPAVRGKVRIAGLYMHVGHLWLALVEFLLAVSVYSAVNGLVHGGGLSPSLSLESLVFSAMVVFSLATMGLYDTHQRHTLLDIGLHIVVALVFCSGAMAAIKYLVTGGGWSYGTMALSAASLSLVYMLLRVLFDRYLDGRILRRKILVLGTGKRAKKIDGLRRKSDQRGFQLVGFIPSKGCQHCYVNPDKILSPKNLRDYAIQHHIDEIVIALDERRQGIPINELLDCRMSGIEITEDLDFFEREASLIQLDLIQRSWLIRSPGFAGNSFSRLCKRLMDILGSLVLALLTLPVMLVTAILIKCECGLRAPVIYTQERVGRGGRSFTIYKFRSMRQDAEADGVAKWASTGDNRITRVGQVIRKYRIDELPQLFNILLGDMSLVGPRPERPEFVENLNGVNEFYNDRHRVAPGLTGWAQLCYPYGASDNDSVQKLKYDLYYIKNRTLFLDIYILLQTAEVVMFKKGAR